MGWWLGLVHPVAARLARRGVHPNVVTVSGLLLAAVAVVPAAAGGRWPLLAVALVVLAGLGDSLDGAVAVLTGRESALGAVLDAVCDRVGDAAFVVTLWVLGAPGVVCVVAAALAWLHEYLRARATVAGMSHIGVVTVSERPTRVVVTAMFVLGAGTFPADPATWALNGAFAWVGLGLVGLAQLTVAVHSALR